MEIEIRVTKVAISTVLIWFFAWTPYAIVCLIGSFGNRNLVSPLVSQIPSFLAKLASALNPIVATFTHPIYKTRLSQLFCEKELKEERNDNSTRHTTTA